MRRYSAAQMWQWLVVRGIHGRVGVFRVMHEAKVLPAGKNTADNEPLSRKCYISFLSDSIHPSALWSTLSGGASRTAVSTCWSWRCVTLPRDYFESEADLRPQQESNNFHKPIGLYSGQQLVPPTCAAALGCLCCCGGCSATGGIFKSSAPWCIMFTNKNSPFPGMETKNLQLLSTLPCLALGLRFLHLVARFPRDVAPS